MWECGLNLFALLVCIDLVFLSFVFDVMVGFDLFVTLVSSLTFTIWLVWVQSFACVYL